jgi:hypothetical protein
MLHAVRNPYYDPSEEIPEIPANEGPRVPLGPRALLQDLRERMRSARELLGKTERELLPTGLPDLDRLLDGGLPRGELVEVVGGRSSGRFSLVLEVLAAATRAGEAAALIDLGDHLDPTRAEAAGVDLARLLWVRPRTVEQALAAAEMLLGAGFPLAVVDLGLPPVRGGRGIEAGWLRLARAAAARGAALLVSAPYRASGTAAAAVVELDRGSARWLRSGASPVLLAGLGGRLALEKRRGGAAGQCAEIAWRSAECLAPSPPEAPPARSFARPRLAVSA